LKQYAVIMAGGTGSRLWPLSRENKPKQFISVEGSKCMLVQTVERICEIIPAERCFIITNQTLLAITRDTVKDLIPVSNIILEPERKNTAACIAYASLLLKEKIGSGILCFVPADGYVINRTGYRSAIERAYRAAENTSGLVIIGVTPSYPATGYGYIQTDAGTEADDQVYQVKHFTEKPDHDTAKAFLSSGDFLWNSGILLGTVDTITDNIKSFIPEHFEKISQAVKHESEPDFYSYIERAYREIQEISFDKGVLEKSGGIHVVKGNFDWDDIGSLDALCKTFRSDSMGNSIQGEHMGLDTSNSVIYSEQGLVATIGVENMIIAHTGDTVLVCSKDRAQDVKSLVEMLKINGYENLV
jgi:mannose-1-phosphate guanylyltransferase